MITTDKALQLSFYDKEGATKRINIKDGKEDLTQEVVEKSMNDIITANIFERNGVDMYNKPKSAEYVERTVKSIFDHSEG